MIISQVGNRLRFVTQADHAHLAAEILSLSVHSLPAGHPRRDALIEAVREHDCGWREADSSPQIDPSTGSPHDFLTLEEARRQEIWSLAIERAREMTPFVGWLVIQHAIELHEGLSAEAWQMLLCDWRELSAEIAADLAVPTAARLDDYRLLARADQLSLALCTRGRIGLTAGSRLEKAGELDDQSPIDILYLEPFSLAGATTFTLQCRFLDAQNYRSSSEFAIALATARWQTVRVRLSPADPRTDRLATAEHPS